MKAVSRFVMVLSVSGALFSAGAMANSWQEQLSSAANALGQSSASGSGTAKEAGTQGDNSLSALAGLLNGGSQSLSAGTMTNAAGVLQYCMKNNLIDNNVSSMKEQLLGKLGLEDSKKQQQSTDYQQGLLGLLNTGDHQQVNLTSLGETPLGKQVKTKACDLVLKQGAKFIS